MKDTEHFKSIEFVCKCCGVEKMQQSIIDVLEVLRVACGCALTVMSGYRCPKHNAEVGGATRSAHLDGLAADITSKMPIKALFQTAERIIPATRIGIDLNGNFLHIDTEPIETYPCRRWYYIGHDNFPMTDVWRKVNLS